MKFHEPGITALFLLFIVSTFYLAPWFENSNVFSEVRTELPKENVEIETQLGRFHIRHSGSGS
jgi:hypothetical protein